MYAPMIAKGTDKGLQRKGFGVTYQSGIKFGYALGNAE